MRYFLISTALAAALFSFDSRAHAGCDTVTPGGGNTATCIAAGGVEMRSINPRPVVGPQYDDAPNDVTVNVEAGAKIDTRNTLDQEGGRARAIDLTGSDDSTIDNKGTILSGDEGLQANDGLIVDNDGVIEAVKKAFDVEKDLVLRNTGNGVIRSRTNEGIEAGDNADITNAGVIEGFDDAIQVAEEAKIVNTGRIENTQTAADLMANPDLDVQGAIDLDNGTIENAGIIKSTLAAAIDFDPTTKASLIKNSGTISGRIAINTVVAVLNPDGSVETPADEGLQTIENSGILEGTSGLALSLGLGADQLTMLTGGTVKGSADFGGGADVLIFDADYVWDSDVAEGARFDGGAGFDTVVFENLTLSDLEVVSRTGDHVSFLVLGSYALNLYSWESFTFGDDTRVALADLTPVPVPAGLVLMATGIAGFGLMRRRARAITKA